MNRARFLDRQDAGRQLAEKLKGYKKEAERIVLGLPRGGVVVAYEIACALRAPLEILLVRKLGVPWHPELAMGAIAEGGVEFLNSEVMANLNISADEIKQVVEKERKELFRRQELYRGHRRVPQVAGKEIILVDDGLATGATMRAAVQALKKKRAKKIIVAVPVGDSGVCGMIREEADDLICLMTPYSLESIGRWYDEFGQTSDEEVIYLLAEAEKKTPREAVSHGEKE